MSIPDLIEDLRLRHREMRRKALQEGHAESVLTGLEDDARKYGSGKYIFKPTPDGTSDCLMTVTEKCWYYAKDDGGEIQYMWCPGIRGEQAERVTREVALRMFQ